MGTARGSALPASKYSSPPGYPGRTLRYQGAASRYQATRLEVGNEGRYREKSLNNVKHQLMHATQSWCAITALTNLEECTEVAPS